MADKKKNAKKNAGKGSGKPGKAPKKDKVKIIAAAPSQKGATAGWQPSFGSGKKK